MFFLFFPALWSQKIMLGDHQRRRICGRCHREYGGRQSHRKGQKISKAIFGVLNSFRNQRIFLLIFAIASEKWLIQKDKGTLLCLLFKFIYSEKATKFCETFIWLLTVCTVVKRSEDFAKFCGLLRMYELYNNGLLFNFLN